MQITPSIARPPILIVDDDASIATLLYEFLSGEGYHVSLARNGQEALNTLARERPALVLCDWMMPTMDGPQLVAALHRWQGAMAATPVVLMSSAHTARDAPPGVRFLAKPFSLDDVLALVSSLTRPDILATMFGNAPFMSPES